MRRLITIILLGCIGFMLNAQENYTISTSGFTFNPALLEVLEGDQITFNVGSMHPVLQVSESTYNANGKTALSGGFSFPSGSGTFTANTSGTIFYVCTNHVSSGMKGKIIVSSTTSISKYKNNNEGFDIYPNPAIESLNILNYQNTEPLTVTVSDISGKTVLFKGEQFSSEDKFLLNISDLNKGIYFISLKFPNKTFTRKLVKQ